MAEQAEPISYLLSLIFYLNGYYHETIDCFVCGYSRGDGVRAVG
jgi:hypothetical protein